MPQELRCCCDGRVLHVYLEGAALRLRALLASAAGRGRRCVALSALSRRVLFPGDPARSWHVFVAGAGTTALPHRACDAAACASSAAPECGCNTCLRGDTECFAGEVIAATPHCAGVSLRLRLSGRHAEREVALILTHHLSGAAPRPQRGFICTRIADTLLANAGAPSPWRLLGVRPGAQLAVLHAHPMLRDGVLHALGACARTTLRVRCDPALTRRPRCPFA